MEGGVTLICVKRGEKNIPDRKTALSTEQNPMSVLWKEQGQTHREDEAVE